MTDRPQCVEPQYDLVFEVEEQHGRARLGLSMNTMYNLDPRKMLFTLARYKFVARMLEGRDKVLEIGCNDAMPSRLVLQTVGHLTAVDIDPIFVQDARARENPAWPVHLDVHDMVKAPYPGRYDGIFCLDVLEHIQPADEASFVANALASLAPTGVFVAGIPSLESQPYASPVSKAGHVNCKTGADLKALMERHFHSVFMFSMNDEVVHTGFFPMAHYLIAVCAHMRADPAA
jgi:SAM-dependent methyltransferase